MTFGLKVFDSDGVLRGVGSGRHVTSIYKGTSGNTSPLFPFQSGGNVRFLKTAKGESGGKEEFVPFVYLRGKTVDNLTLGHIPASQSILAVGEGGEVYSTGTRMLAYSNASGQWDVLYPMDGFNEFTGMIPSKVAGTSTSAGFGLPYLCLTPRGTHVLGQGIAYNTTASGVDTRVCRPHSANHPFNFTATCTGLRFWIDGGALKYAPLVYGSVPSTFDPHTLVANFPNQTMPDTIGEGWALSIEPLTAPLAVTATWAVIIVSPDSQTIIAANLSVTNSPAGLDPPGGVVLPATGEWMDVSSDGLAFDWDMRIDVESGTRGARVGVNGAWFALNGASSSTKCYPMGEVPLGGTDTYYLNGTATGKWGKALNIYLPKSDEKYVTFVAGSDEGATASTRVVYTWSTPDGLWPEGLSIGRLGGQGQVTIHDFSDITVTKACSGMIGGLAGVNGGTGFPTASLPPIVAYADKNDPGSLEQVMNLAYWDGDDYPEAQAAWQTFINQILDFNVWPHMKRMLTTATSTSISSGSLTVDFRIPFNNGLTTPPPLSYCNGMLGGLSTVNMHDLVIYWPYDLPDDGIMADADASGVKFFPSITANGKVVCHLKAGSTPVWNAERGLPQSNNPSMLQYIYDL